MWWKYNVQNLNSARKESLESLCRQSCLTLCASSWLNFLIEKFQMISFWLPETGHFPIETIENRSLHRGAFCQFPFCCHSSKSTGKKLAKRTSVHCGAGAIAGFYLVTDFWKENYTWCIMHVGMYCISCFNRVVLHTMYITY